MTREGKSGIMVHKYTEIAFTERVKQFQEKAGSRHSYARFEAGDEESHKNLGEREIAFIAARDSFYMASVSETGWPYVQHRGGPPGFVKILGDDQLAFPDFRGNRQYVSVGNLSEDDRVSLFFMDYANRARLKMFGHAHLSEDAALLEELSLPEYRAHVERAMVIEIAGFDWNCPQHIPQRYTEAEFLARNGGGG